MGKRKGPDKKVKGPLRLLGAGLIAAMPGEAPREALVEAAAIAEQSRWRHAGIGRSMVAVLDEPPGKGLLQHRIVRAIHQLVEEIGTEQERRVRGECLLFASVAARFLSHVSGREYRVAVGKMTLQLGPGSQSIVLGERNFDIGESRRQGGAAYHAWTVGLNAFGEEETIDLSACEYPYDIAVATENLGTPPWTWPFPVPTAIWTPTKALPSWLTLQEDPILRSKVLAEVALTKFDARVEWLVGRVAADLVSET